VLSFLSCMLRQDTKNDQIFSICTYVNLRYTNLLAFLLSYMPSDIASECALCNDIAVVSG